MKRSVDWELYLKLGLRSLPNLLFAIEVIFSADRSRSAIPSQQGRLSAQGVGAATS